MGSHIKQEVVEFLPEQNGCREIITISSSSSSSSSSGSWCSLFSNGGTDEPDVELIPRKRQKVEAPLPVGFLDPIRTVAPPSNGNVVAAANDFDSVKEESNVDENTSMHVVSEEIVVAVQQKEKEKDTTVMPGYRQFWKAGDYEGCSRDGGVSFAEMDHARVHPKFLHSNATSHKWALGAFAELLDNALDEVCNGATYVHVDVLENMKDRTKMVLVEDNGGGMAPEKMRQCMSLGYSAKSKMANTIGQYGNGFKTSTMRLGADVIVFSRCDGKYGGSTTQSIGMLSYTFLRNTGKEDIIVPMIDYVKRGETWDRLVKSSSECWQRNLDTIVQWSPYESEEHLLQQFDFLKDQGTSVIVYNLWEDDQGSAELDLETDPHDIQIRGVSRDEKKIEMAKSYKSSRHFLTYRHSLRSYASILYLRMPPGFRIILRGKDVDHHNIVDDLMHATDLVYKPAYTAEMPSKNPNMVAVVTIGFVKDAVHHIDVQGFNVYHKNRLIKPFWRVWNAAGSDGRGVVGVLEANFVEPAHDKQGFERTIVLSRLEAKLITLQKNYWSKNCQLIGYAHRRQSKKKSNSPVNEVFSSSADNTHGNVTTKGGACAPKTNGRSPVMTVDELAGRSRFEAHATNHNSNPSPSQSECPLGEYAGIIQVKTEEVNEDGSFAGLCLMLKEENDRLKEENDRMTKSLNNELQFAKDRINSLEKQAKARDEENAVLRNSLESVLQFGKDMNKFLTEQIKAANDEGSAPFPSLSGMVVKYMEENDSLRNSLKNVLQHDKDKKKFEIDRNKYERDRNKSLEKQMDQMKAEMDQMKVEVDRLKQERDTVDQEMETVVSTFSEERTRRDQEEVRLRSRIEDASETIHNLLTKVKILEGARSW